MRCRRDHVDTFNVCEVAFIKASQYVQIIRNQQVDGSSPFPGFFFSSITGSYMFYYCKQLSCSHKLLECSKQRAFLYRNPQVPCIT